MDPSSLPTDSLYKFYTLGGLAFAGLCLWAWWKHRQRHAELEEDLAHRADVASATVERIRKRLEADEARMVTLQSEYAEAVEAGDDGLMRNVRREMKVLASSVKDRSKECDESLAEVGKLGPAVQAQGKRSRRVTIETFVLIAGAAYGAGISWQGLNLWSERLQGPLDTKLKLELEVQTLELQAKKRALQAAAAKFEKDAQSADATPAGGAPAE